MKRRLHANVHTSRGKTSPKYAPSSLQLSVENRLAAVKKKILLFLQRYLVDKDAQCTFKQTASFPVSCSQFLTFFLLLIFFLLTDVHAVWLLVE